jgi:hypothetical protein
VAGNVTEPITIAEELARKWEAEASEKQAERAERPSRPTMRMRLGTTTYQVAEVSIEEARDPDANWEAWDWKPLDRSPDYFIRPIREES